MKLNKMNYILASMVSSTVPAVLLVCFALSNGVAHADSVPLSDPGKVCVSPDEYGARHTSNNDDTAAIQAAIDASRNGDPSHGVVRGTPICFLAGAYYITKSLDFTDGPDGWRIYGAGLGEGTIISASFDEPYPIMDFTGTIRMRISDLTVRGISGGITTGILLARSAGGKGDEAYLDNVQFELVSAKLTQPVAALVNVCSDLMTVVHSKFYGPTGLVISGRNIKKINTKSKRGFYSGGGNSCNTLQKVRDSQILSSRNEGILFSGGDAMSVDGTYFAVEGRSTAAIRLVPDGGGGGDNLYLSDIRTETPSSASPTYVLDALVGSNGGKIEGVFQVRGGPYVHVPAGVNLAGYIFQMTLNDPAIPLVGGGGSVFNSIFSSAQGVPASLGPMGASNTTLGVKPK